VHFLKGNAGALRFEWFADQLHTFETNIEAIQKASEINVIRGRDLLPLTMQLKKLYESIETIRELRSKLLAYGIEYRSTAVESHAISTPISIEPKENQRWFDLGTLVQDLSVRAGVKVKLNLRGFHEALEPRLNEALYPMAVQMVRNSIVHGIEGIELRRRLKKPEIGQIIISLSDDGDGNYRFLFEDDGRGFDYEAIRSGLVRSGFDADKVSLMSNSDLVRRTFSEQFSTSDVVTMDAGRGVGLPAVMEKLKKIGASLKVRSVKNEFTQLIVDFNIRAFDRAERLAV
jgi:chemotaxis protein histidine kinase CheA